MKPGSLLAVLLLALIAIGHVLRLVFRVEATLDGIAIPMWASIIGVVVPGAVALLLWWETRARG